MNKLANKTINFKERLIHEISSGLHEFGGRLPGQRQLCRQYGISRTTVANGLAELVQDGWLTARSRSGFFVAEKAKELIGASPPGSKECTICFFLPPAQAGNPLLKTILTTFCQYADSHVHVRVVFLDMSLKPDDDWETPEYGVVIGLLNQEFLHEFSRKVQTLIVLNVALDEFNYIAPDHYSGGYQVAEYLVENHHTRVGCIRYKEEQSGTDFGSRFLGICRSFIAARISIVNTFIPVDNFFDVIRPCHQAVDELLREDPAITAILCPSDMAAVGVYDALQSKGIRIPEQMSVIGFDDQFYAGYLSPRLTTLKYPAAAIGMRMAECVNNRIRTIAEKIVPVLIRRESVDSAPKLYYRFGG